MTSMFERIRAIFIKDEEEKRTPLCMDNFHIDITARGRDNLERILDVVLMSNTPTHWCSHPDKGTIYFWSKPDRVPEGILVYGLFPEWATAKAWADDVNTWLSIEDYGPQPDLDGSCSKGFRVYNEHYGRIDGFSNYSFLAIKPEWAEHHK